jgi:hypothetical protein
MQNILYFDKLDQNLLHSVVLNAKINFAFRPRSFAFQRSRSKSLGFYWVLCRRVMQNASGGCGGTCRELTPARLECKYFGFRQPPSKSFSSDRLLIKILHFVQNHLHFDAADQNPLDLMGFPVIGSCSTPAASLHPSPVRHPLSSFY